jgi:hypothetical protein
MEAAGFRRAERLQIEYGGVLMRKLRLLALTLGLPFAIGSAACGGDDEPNGDNGPNGQGSGTVRFLNVANGLSNPIDIYRRNDVLNEDNPVPIAANLEFGNLSGAVEVPAGTQTYLAFFAGDPAEPGRQVFEATGLTITADADNIITFFTNANADTEARAFVDDLEDPAGGNGRFRFFHYAANFGDGAISLYDAADNRDPTVLREGIQFGSAASDLQLLVGEFVLGFGATREGAPERQFEFNVTPGAFEAFIISDGSVDNLYLLDDAGNLAAPIAATDFVPPGQGQVNFVHLANGADAVDIFVEDDDEAQVTNLQEYAATGNRPVTEGSYTVTVVETGDPIDNAVATLEGFSLGASDNLTVVIYDDAQGNVQIAELPEEDPSGVGTGETKFRVSHFAPALQNVALLNAAVDPPVSLGESFDDVAFGATTDYSSNRPSNQDIVLGVDADDDPRGDLEVRFDLGQFESTSTYNVLLDSVDGGASGITYQALLVPSGGGARGPETGETIADPSFVRPIHLVSAYGTGPNEEVDFYIDFSQQVASNIGYLDSGRMYVEVDSDPSANLSFVASGGMAGSGITEPRELKTITNHTVVFHGRRCQPASDCDITVIDDDPPSTTVPAGQVRLRFFHAARNVPGVSINSQPGGISETLAGEGEVSGYTNVPVDTYQFRVTAGANTFDFTVEDTQWNPQGIYTAYIVQDVDDNQLLVLQDQAGNTTTIRQRGELRAVSLLTNTQGLATNTQFSLAGAVVAPWTPIEFATPTTPISVEANSYNGEFNDGVAGSIPCNFRVVAEEVTTLVGTGLTDGSATCLGLGENAGAPPAMDEFAWRFYHGADRFGDPMANSQINVTVLNDSPPTAYNNVGFGASAFGGFLNRENTGITLGVDVDPPSMNPEYELIFEVPALNDGEEYTFVLTRLMPDGPNPSGGPVVLYAYSDQGDSRIIGARSNASLFNLSPDAGTVDVHVDGDTTPEVTAVPYPTFSDDFDLDSGEREIAVVEEGAGLGSPLATVTDAITGGETVRQTLVFFGRAPNRELRVFSNPPLPQMQAPGPGEIALRVIHAAQGFDAVNLFDHTNTGQTPVSLNFQPIPEGTASGYITLPSAQPVTLGVDVVATNSQSATTEKSDYFFQIAGLIDQGQYNLIVGHDPTTGEVVGFLERLAQPFGADHQVIAADPLARVRLFHGSRIDGQVDLQIGGSPSAIAGVGIGEASRWAAVTPGTVDFDVVPAGGTTPRASASSVTLDSGGSYTLTFAVIEGVAELSVVEDDFADITDVRVRGIHLVDSPDPSFDVVDVLDVSAPPPPFPIVFEDVPQGGASPTTFSAPTATSLLLGIDTNDDGTNDATPFQVPSSVMTAGQHLNISVYTDAAGDPAPVAILGDSFVEPL